MHGDHFLLLLLPGEDPRVGLTVSSKVGTAVTRNRVKRWVREYVRRHKELLPRGDAVIVAKGSVASASHEQVDRDLERLLARVRGARG